MQAKGQTEEVVVAPVETSGRIDALDFIRGVAVMGILTANIVAFGQPLSAYMWPGAFLVPDRDPGGWLWIAQFVLVDGKMRGLFTLLFGAGMMLFMEKAWASGASRWLQARRLLWLLVFGLLHFFLIWRGDILSYYALIGAVALFCLRWQAKTQLTVGLLGYLVGALVYAAMIIPTAYVADTAFGEAPALSGMRSDLEAGKADALAEDAAMTALKSGGDYAALTAYRVSQHWAEPFTNALLFLLETLPLMLIGVALYRYGLFNGGIDRERLLRWGWAGLIVGGALHLAIGLWARAGGFTYYGTLAAFMGWSPLPRLLMVLGLAALLTVAAARATGWLGERVRAAGRAAFTNYLGTSLVLMPVFHGWALGLFGKLDRPQLYGVMVLVWVVMLLWSRPWLKRFRYGPFEWLWRCLTYGKVFPLRR